MLVAVRACRSCEANLQLGPRPVLRAAATSRILNVGQAPGDPSGVRRRAWMGVGKDAFYDESRVAIIPI